MTEKEELILVKMLFKAIKKKDISTMTELTEKVDMTDQEMINSYLFQSMKSKNIVSFNYFLNKLDDINNYLIRRIFSKKNNEPYKESVLKHIQHFPQNYSSLSYIYSTILAYTIRYNKLENLLIDDLLHHPILDFTNQIKNQFYLSKFVHVFSYKVKKDSLKISKKLLDFFTPFIDDKHIELESLLFAMIINENYDKIHPNYFKSINLNKKVIFYHKIYTHGFYWDKDYIEDDETYDMKKDEHFEQIKDTQISLGSLLKLKLRIKNIDGKEYIIPKEDKELIEKYCKLYDVTNINESVIEKKPE